MTKRVRSIGRSNVLPLYDAHARNGSISCFSAAMNSRSAARSSKRCCRRMSSPSAKRATPIKKTYVPVPPASPVVSVSRNSTSSHRSGASPLRPRCAQITGSIAARPTISSPSSSIETRRSRTSNGESSEGREPTLTEGPRAMGSRPPGRGDPVAKRGFRSAAAAGSDPRSPRRSSRARSRSTIAAMRARRSFIA